MTDKIGFNSNKKTLPKFVNSWARLPEYLAEANEEIEALQISNTLVGYIDVSALDIIQGDPFIVGEKYNVDTTETGDDFSNIGWVEDGVDFIATGTTPTTWENDSVVYWMRELLEIIYNDIDPNNTTIEHPSQTTILLNITNNGFVQGKTYPASSFTNVVINSTNQIEFNANTGGNSFFKVEVYV